MRPKTPKKQAKKQTQEIKIFNRASRGPSTGSGKNEPLQETPETKESKGDKEKKKEWPTSEN